MIQTENKVEYYVGTIVATAREGHELLKNTAEFQEVVVDIPGVIQGILCHPINGMNDEPRVGNPVLVTSYDPNDGSYYTYQVLKENDFIGFRASGAMVDIQNDNDAGTITIGVYDQGAEFKDGERPDCSQKASIVISGKDDSITINAKGNITINGEADCNITINGNTNLNVSGNATIKASGTLETNGGTWKTGNGLGNQPSTNGPFNSIPTCPFSSLPHCSQTC